MDNYIEFKGITKAFPGQIALDGVSFSVKKGEVHALLGENGAGKSTLLNIFHGLFPATKGEVLIDGKTAHYNSAHEAIEGGISKVHQEINLVPEMTVMQNILLGDEYKKGFLLDQKSMKLETDKILLKLKCNFSSLDPVWSLNTGEKQMVQIAKALHTNAKIISFDEPTSSLSSKEVDALFGIIEGLREQGITILYISHKLDEIYRLCDRATILRDGKYQGTYKLEGLPKEVLIKNMVGRDVEMFAKRENDYCADMSTVVLSAKNISGPEGYKNVSFDLHKGEILGFFGLVGAKRTETMNGLFGVTPLASGTIEVKGKQVTHISPPNMIAHGVGFLPENRKEVGYVKDLDNTDNMSLASLNMFKAGLLQNRKRKEKNAIEKGRVVGLTPNDPEFMTSDLSGGNQQKVIVAKWLTTDADILIFDEPTKGIDVGAKADIYSIMEGLLAKGKSIIMISSELPEVIGMSDRIIVMHEGDVMAVLSRDDFSESGILSYAVGGKLS